MDIVFTVETTNGKTWKATCKDPELEVEGTDIVSVSKSMATMIEKWFATTFDTNKMVIVEVPVIKAKIKASVVVRSEKPLDDFADATQEIPVIPIAVKECEICGMEVTTDEDDPHPICDSCKYEKKVGQGKKPKATGPCMYLSDGKGVLPVGACEAFSNEPGDTPGLRADGEGVCKGDFEKCTYYKSMGTKQTTSPPPSPLAEDDDEIPVDEMFPEDDD